MEIQPTHTWTQVELQGIAAIEQPVDEVVSSVIAHSGIHYQSAEAERAVMDQKRTLYTKFEQHIRQAGAQIPIWADRGPLHFGMSLETMRQVTRQNLRQLSKAGQVVFSSDLSSKFPTTSFHVPPQNSERSEGNLTRIWGSEYLKRCFSDSTSFDAARHYLVIDDGAATVDVLIIGYNSGTNEQPTLGKIRGAQVISERIEGSGCAREPWHQPNLRALGYVDFKDNGNVIRDPSDKLVVVDTEMKSFEHKRPAGGWGGLCDYLARRNAALKGPCYDWITISVADLGLETSQASAPEDA